MENKKILIVDDDPDLTKVIQVILESEQYIVATAANRHESMEKIKTEQPDLIMLDVMMDTWEDGFEIARELKKNDEYNKIPILMLTGVQEKTGIEFKSTAGDKTWCPVDGFLDKPVEPEVLLAEIRKLLANK